MSKNRERTLTLVVKTKEKYPQWILDAHLGNAKYGVKVLSISEGDVVKEHDRLLEEIEERDIDDFARNSEGDLE